MPTLFFVSSVGDTDLAKATIAKLIETTTKDPVFIVPVTLTAQERIKDLSHFPSVTQISLAAITEQKDILSKKEISAVALLKLADFIEKNKISRAYVGVPSPIDEDIPFQIARSLKIPCTIAYEYMFNAPSAHPFWNHLDSLALQKDCDFAVPLQSAKNEIQRKNKKAAVNVIGHLSIDRAFLETKIEKKAIRTALAVNDDDELVFISGTTQPAPMDKNLVEALLSEMVTGQYPQLKLRFGIHPGVKDLDGYLKELLDVCAKYPAIKNQFKIILSAQLKARLQTPLQSEFILESDVTGSAAAESADKITQAVPGALLNEAALKGKPVYFHENSSVPYLPESFFAKDIATFFKAKGASAYSREQLGLKESAPNNMLKLMLR